jgi:hypothetical protein
MLQRDLEHAHPETVRDDMGRSVNQCVDARACVRETCRDALVRLGTVGRSGSFRARNRAAGGAEPRFSPVFKSLYRRMGWHNMGLLGEDPFE